MNYLLWHHFNNFRFLLETGNVIKYPKKQNWVWFLIRIVLYSHSRVTSGCTGCKKMTSSLIKIFLNTKLIVFATKWCHFSYFTISFPVGSQTGSWKYVNMEVEYELILSWNFRNNRGRKTTKIGLLYFSISDFEIGGAYSGKGMTSRPPLKILKVSSDCLLC